MKHYVKKLLAFMVALCVACTTVSMPVSAGNGPNPDEGGWAYVSVGNGSSWTYLYHAQDPSSVTTVSGMSYSKATNTLTLNGFNNTGKIIAVNEMGEDFKIKVTGTNHIQQIIVYGYGYGGSLALSGTGTLYINENKQVEVPICLEAEFAKAQLKIGSDFTVKAYRQSGHPGAYVSYSATADNGIVFEGNSRMNAKVTKEKLSVPKSCNAYKTDHTATFFDCTSKDPSDTATYGAIKYTAENGNPYYEICKMIEVDGVGTVAKPATDEFGNPLEESNFNIANTYKQNICYMQWTSQVYICKNSEDSSKLYASFSYYYNGEGPFYSMYSLVEADNSEIHALFAVPIEGEQQLSSIPSKYTQEVEQNPYYNYSYDGDINIEKVVNADPCAGGHKLKTTTTKATTSKNGKIVKTCTVCGKTISTTTIPKVSTIKLSDSSYTYNGKTKTPSVTVKDSKGKTLKKNTDYTVTYGTGRKSVGQYTVKVTLKGNYSGSKTLKFTINPKSTSLSSVKAKKKAVLVKWKKQTSQTSGYQIQYSTDKNFKKSTKEVTVSKNTTTSKTISNLKAKKKYYVRVRTYNTVKISGKSTKLYSSWSKAKSVTTLK